jgi:hypothetical protein
MAIWTRLRAPIFAYVDIFEFFRADVLDVALDGRIATTAFTVDQVFLTATLSYLLPSILMVVLTLLLTPRVNRTVNIVVIEVVLLVVIARAAWRWPSPAVAPSLP